MRFLLSIAGLLLAPVAVAQDLVPETVFAITGECRQLQLGEEDLTALCAPELIQVTYVGAQMELFVSTHDEDGRFLVFAGPVAEADGLAVQAVNQVIVGQDPMGNEVETLNAEGECLRGDAHGGEAEFSCDVIDAGGVRYAVSFVSAGTPPDNMID